MTNEFQALSGRPLSEIAQSILDINGGKSGQVCFPTPFGETCIDTDTDGLRAKTLELKAEDVKETTLADALNELTSDYKALGRAGVTGSEFSYKTEKFFPIALADRDSQNMRLFSIGVSVSF